MSLERSEPDFIDSPPDDLVCSICLLVLSEPELTSCCGNHFCRPCVKQVQVERRPCPLCSAPEFSSMLDKSIVRKVNQLNVACSQKDEGCDWVGSYADLGRHQDPQVGGCKFMIMECTFDGCGARFHRRELSGHQVNCTRRPFTCKYCDYKTAFCDLESHWEECAKYPLACPNNCGDMDVQRCHMDYHLRQECTTAVVPCGYAYAGCQVVALRRDMAEHLSDCVQDHLQLVSLKCFSLSQQFPADLQQKLSESLHQRDLKISHLEKTLNKRDQEMSMLREKLESLEVDSADFREDTRLLKSTLFVPPFDFVMTDFKKYLESDDQWIGPPFYSHVGGYCMCVSVDANGVDDGHGTHVSLYVNIMKGDYDESLEWPFLGSVTINLLNQRHREEGHYEEKVLFTRETPLEVSGRVGNGREVAESGLGIPKFIEHLRLGYIASKNTEYLRCNSLRLRVKKVEIRRY